MCRPGNNNPNYRNGEFEKISKECFVCSKVFIGVRKNIYCSIHCHNLFQKISGLTNNRIILKANKIALRFIAHRPVKKIKIVKIKEIKPPKEPKEKKIKAFKIKEKKGRKKPKIWNCEICNLIVERRVRWCKNCRPKKPIFKTICKNCGKEVFKWEGAKFCNMKCQGMFNKGANNPNYREDTPELTRIRKSTEYKNWRISVFKRDKYTCQHCGQIGGTLHADHIKQFAYFPEFRLDINNGRTLCFNCHKKTDTYLKGQNKELLKINLKNTCK